MGWLQPCLFQRCKTNLGTVYLLGFKSVCLGLVKREVPVPMSLVRMSHCPNVPAYTLQIPGVLNFLKGLAAERKNGRKWPGLP